MVSEKIRVICYYLNRVKEIIYFGIILKSNSSIAMDVDVPYSPLMRQFNALYQKFKFLDMPMI